MYNIRYFNLQRKYEAEYGKNTIVLYHNGIFYEALEYDPVDCKNEEDKIDREGNVHHKHIGHATKLGEILNLLVVLKNNSEPYSFNNCYAVGLHESYLESKITTLIKNYYTVIVVENRTNNDGVIEKIIDIRRELGG